MRNIFIVSILILIVWWVITMFGASSDNSLSGVFNSMDLTKRILTKRVLWMILIFLLSLLAYKSYSLSNLKNGSVKFFLRVYMWLSIGLAIISILIFVISIGSIWM